MYHPPTLRGVEIPQEQQKRARKQPPNQVWLDAIMSKSGSTEPPSSISSVTEPRHYHHPHGHASMPPPNHARMLVDDTASTWHQDRPPPPPPMAPPVAPPPPIADIQRTHRSSRSPSPVVTASALQALSDEASAVAESRYNEQLSLEHSALETLIVKALKDMVADQDCCFIARGECHLCTGTNLVPVVNFCPDFSPTHSLCREHLRSMHRVRLEDIFAGKNQPTVSKRALRCTVCSLSCPCSKCQVVRNDEIARYKQWLAVPSHGSPSLHHQEEPVAERPGTSRSSDSEMDPNGRSARSRPRERTPPLPSTAMPKDDTRHRDEGRRDIGASQRRLERSSRNGSEDPVGAEFSPPYAEEKYVESDRRGVDRALFGYGAAVESPSGLPLTPLFADEKRPMRANRVPKRAAKESVPYPLDTFASSGYASRDPTSREHLLGGRSDVTPAMASPSAASVLNCPDSEKSLVDLLSSLNQQITPAVRFFIDEEEPPIHEAPPASSSRVDEDVPEPGRQIGVEESDPGASVDESDMGLHPQKRKREGAPAKQTDAVPSSSRGDGKEEAESDQGRVDGENGSSTYRQKAPAPLTTSEKKTKPPQGVSSRVRPLLPSPSPRGRPSSRSKAAAAPATVPKNSSRKREAPSDSIPTPPASSRRRKTDAALVVPAQTPSSERKTSRGPDHRGHAHKPAKGPRPLRDGGRGRKKKSKRADADSDEDVRYVPGEDEDDEDLMEEGGEEVEEEDDELDTNLDYCEVCLAAGDLVCCDICPRSFHLKCLKMTEDDLPEGDWQCAECKKPSYFESFMVSVAEKTTVPAKCLQIVQCLKSHPFAKQFLLPVENVPHYAAVVKQPMDLTTIEKKILDGKYMVSGKGTLQGGNGAAKILHLGSFAEDVRLVWGNCKLFNDDGSGITRAADHLSEGFEKLYQHVLNFVEKASFAPKPTSQPRREEKKPAAQAKPSEVRAGPAVANKAALPSKGPAAKSADVSITELTDSSNNDSANTTSQPVPNAQVDSTPKTTLREATTSSELKAASKETVAKESVVPPAKAPGTPESADPRAPSTHNSVPTPTEKPTSAPSVPRSTPSNPIPSSGSVTPSPTDSTTTTFVQASATSTAVSKSLPPAVDGSMATDAAATTTRSAANASAPAPPEEQESPATTTKAAENVVKESIV